MPTDPDLLIPVPSLARKGCCCGGIMQQVINAEEQLRKGWYCPTCNGWEQAILRERVWRTEDDS